MLEEIRKMNKPLIILGLLLFAVFLLASGAIDIDWMIVSYRYSEWHRSQLAWEFCPWFKLSWWDAYMFTLARIIAGTGMLFSCLTWIYMRLSSATKN